MKNKKPIYVLGTGLSPHDGSACLLKDGEIVVAIEKERLTRKKHDGANDNLAINYCLNSEGIKINDLTLIVQCGDSHIYLEDYHKMWGGNGKRLITKGEHNVPIISISHHLAHAYNAIGLAPFDEMAICIIDGFGQSMKYCIDLQGEIFPKKVSNDFLNVLFEKDSFYFYSKDGMKTIFKDFSCRKDFPHLSMFPFFVDHSIGDLYEQASTYCLGNRSNEMFRQAGKLMGLAPYGNPKTYQTKIFQFENGRVFVKDDWQKKFDKPCLDYEDFKNRFQYFADIAYWIQKETENAILNLLNERFKICNVKNLAYSGGLALNAVINAKILDSTPFENLYVTPAAGDNGLAIGCAYYGWLEILKNPRKKNNGNTCFGKIYSSEEIQSAINNFFFTDNINNDKIIDNFFNVISECIIPKHLPKSDFIFQIKIKEYRIYNLVFNDKKCDVLKEITQKPLGVISISSSDFIKWMLGSITIPDLITNHKLIVEGDIPNMEHSLDKNKAESIMVKLLNNFSTNNQNVQYTKEKDIISITADLLAAGYTIGWFQEGSEFGPRALGHRSILADPRRTDIKDFINSKVKFREDFRPFAPSVLLEDVQNYFRFQGESPYMLMIAQVQPEWREKIPGVVHEDGSCRIQTVTENWNKKYYKLLNKFKEKTGIGVLLNTSFNRRKMPIVETPNEALNFFYECDLDFLVMGDFLIRK
ncbi:carbamoyltransferase family protein [Aquimarina algiphila]|uniref:Transferase n=1 Tax=Aquimarina algiphila TaxID=2047982 RepID=A0A554VIT2_9FLAO|nr:carbamoyltransferase C-terminal domain-containing protein [Aquimarina algiphila]TSE07720.1 hypothetical protein FOF46_14930 [Aquimarina algiphila]